MSATSQTQQYSKDFIEGVLQGLKILSIYLENGDKLTLEAIEGEANHYRSLPVLPESKADLELLDMQRSQEAMELFHASLEIIPHSIGKVREALKTIGLEAVPITK